MATGTHRPAMKPSTTHLLRTVVLATLLLQAAIGVEYYYPPDDDLPAAHDEAKCSLRVAYEVTATNIQTDCGTMSIPLPEDQWIGQCENKGNKCESKSYPYSDFMLEYYCMPLTGHMTPVAVVVDIACPSQPQIVLRYLNVTACICQDAETFSVEV